MRMQLKMYSIRDLKGAYYNAPFFSRSHGEAERSFERVARDTQSTINQYPSDYDLYCVGEFDDQTATITPKSAPEFIMNAVQFKTTPNQGLAELKKQPQFAAQTEQKIN